MTAKITMSLKEYLAAGNRFPVPSRACFACGHVGPPRFPTAREASSGCTERRCGKCDNAAAVPVDQAARERWLVVEHEGRVVSPPEIRS